MFLLEGRSCTSSVLVIAESLHFPRSSNGLNSGGELHSAFFLGPLLLVLFPITIFSLSFFAPPLYFEMSCFNISNKRNPQSPLPPFHIFLNRRLVHPKVTYNSFNG
ncbi:hypothetical protein K435DRAFT_89631 [Dendrothele bispora CBS 962.96]|uniref:Uncharacterized protein n=1 Tax=Dendrothele bispora (strain CBS 962.96) TaxID=1314807 RepID=A0A4S8M3A6_DENBC|nr:hypothetical protein K435DRAFT_89631 [Dendrothele bispora CBS 962.96]